MFNEVKSVLDEIPMLMINCLLIMFIIKGLILSALGIEDDVYKLYILGGLLSVSSALIFLFINTFIIKAIKIFTILVILQFVINLLLFPFLKGKIFKNTTIESLINNAFFISCISNLILIAISIRFILFNYVSSL
ncbi:hypothetical protein ACSXEW_12455 [Clostridium perfringens]|uniref:Uncharacterized protein n=1 Tax=Clostridium perfringens D str. JGS1721 TaxID=488537 RepID=B1V6Q7_CLOPF|nr:hypothetical protein [Clostridium perfringens]EDT70106.1 hypothetical protein CJD_A0656 [Clostridium perfringens D str. JGS1721]EDT70412.1 hypothetical protein CJD_A0275 [Clostridium perfringens D str. JGS1721]EDT70467.1 hypothetical protein CJD_A0332 [Clostridium perfringens D str. JGS1721]EDT70504.1 hypothetical protein CJD_0696 [Clostridium perfringens D str. JGS1721]